MLQLLPRRQVSHNEPQCDRVVLRERKTSDGALEREYSNGTVTLERKTRHGSVISIESTHSDAQPEAAEVKKSLLIEELRKEVRIWNSEHFELVLRSSPEICSISLLSRIQKC
ncbi:hypothetical protein L596_018391 [Steinernema carpocapsae]|uniref:Uncharacterized protein n=1 Tax=Steinernema carpocapsae TaxID=34508 RepID=A0A4U5N4J1_STECR|nr:hypothetical protein L596_018391 [Steinernema carpocapsae]